MVAAAPFCAGEDELTPVSRRVSTAFKSVNWKPYLKIAHGTICRWIPEGYDHPPMKSTSSFGGRRYETHGPERYGFPAASDATNMRQQQAVATPPLDVYWSASRKDMRSLASDASRAQVLAQKQVARVPTAC